MGGKTINVKKNKPFSELHSQIHKIVKSASYLNMYACI